MGLFGFFAGGRSTNTRYSINIYGNRHYSSGESVLEVQLRELKSTAEHELKSLKPNRQTADDPSSTCSELHLSTQEVIADPLGVIAGPPTQPSEEVFALGFLNSGAGCSQGSALFQLSRICSDGLVLCRLLNSACPCSLDVRAVNRCSTQDRSTNDPCDHSSLEDVNLHNNLCSEPDSPPTHARRLGPERVRENLQLFLSCAEAAGCDMQHCSFQQLADGQPAALTYAVLEVVRAAVVQAMPPLERRWLEAWTEPRSPTSSTVSPRGAWGGEPGSSSSSSGGSSNGSPHSSSGSCSRRLFRAAVGHGGSGAGSSTGGSASAAAVTAAALEGWVVHLLQTQEAQLTRGPCGEAADLLLRAHTSVLTHTSAEGCRPAGHGGAVGLEQWRQLAAVLGCIMQQRSGGPTASGHGEEDVRMALGQGQGDGDSRWEAVAVTLTRLLRCTEAAGSIGGRPPPLPPLRGCYLRSRHPVLRAVLLLYVLLAVGRAREAAGGRWGAGSDVSTGAVAPPGGAQQQQRQQEDKQQRACEEQIVELEHDQQLVLCRSMAATSPLASPAPPAPAPPPASVGPAPKQQQRQHGDLCPLLLSSNEPLRSGLDTSARTLASGPLAAAADAEADWRPTGGRLWAGEGEEDDAGTNQEERVMRLWLNSLAPGVLRVGSLFEPRMSTGWPLLQALDALQPGCVPWAAAFRPPFKDNVRKLLSVQNCNLVVRLCARELALPNLVNIGGLDLAQGNRRAMLSLVFQLMRHHMGLLLGLTLQRGQMGQTGQGLEQQEQGDWQRELKTSASGPVGVQARRALGGGLEQGPRGSASGRIMEGTGEGSAEEGSPWRTPLRRCVSSAIGQEQSWTPGSAGGLPARQRSAAGRCHGEVERAVLEWANARLAEGFVAAAEAHAAAQPSGVAGLPEADHGQQQVQQQEQQRASVGRRRCGSAPVLAGFSDPRLGRGWVLLQLLAAVRPHAVDPVHVLPGNTQQERESNAKYLLSCARKAGCAILLGWEDVMAARPNLMLLLVASFMALDMDRRPPGQQHPQQQ